jgi:hypothetical protein
MHLVIISVYKFILKYMHYIIYFSEKLLYITLKHLKDL